jgi:hypothetical protein
MTDEQDKLILAKWQELGQKQNQDFDINKDVNYAYLFCHFAEEDQEEAWQLIPEHKEVRKRIDELLAGSMGEDEMGDGIPMYVLPSGKNIPSADFAIDLVKEHFSSIKKYISEDEFSDELKSILNSPQFEAFNKDQHSYSDSDEDLEYEVSEILSEYSCDAGQEAMCYYALDEYVVHMTKIPDVTNYIMTPTFTDEYKNSHLYDNGFKMYLSNISYWLMNDGKVVVKIGDEEE